MHSRSRHLGRASSWGTLAADLSTMPKRRSMTFVALGALCFVLGVTSLSWGHVAPSVDDNNRYLKVTPMADGIRFAYTVFFGEIPGASERKHIDANGDG